MFFNSIFCSVFLIPRCQTTDIMGGMSEELNAMIRQELVKRNLSERAASTRAGLSETTLNFVLTHPESNPSSGTSKKIARFFGFNEDRVLELAGHKTPPITPIPVPTVDELIRRLQNEVPIAVPIYETLTHAGEGAGVPTDQVYLPPRVARGRKLAAIYVKGDCMAPIVNEGDRVVIDLEASPRVGDIVVVAVDKDEIELRRFIGSLDGRVRLGCENPTHSEIEVEDVRIIGTVIETGRRLRD